MEHPILQIFPVCAIIKIQKRSESNVLTKHPFKTVESRGYVNAGARQLLKPLTFGVRGFNFAGMRIYENYTTTAVSLRAGCCSLFDKTEFIELALTAPMAPLVRGAVTRTARLRGSFLSPSHLR